MTVPAPAASAAVIVASCSGSNAEYTIWNASKVPQLTNVSMCGLIADTPMKRAFPDARTPSSVAMQSCVSTSSTVGPCSSSTST